MKTYIENIKRIFSIYFIYTEFRMNSVCPYVFSIASALTFYRACVINYSGTALRHYNLVRLTRISCVSSRRVHREIESECSNSVKNVKILVKTSFKVIIKIRSLTVNILQKFKYTN